MCTFLMRIYVSDELARIAGYPGHAFMTRSAKVYKYITDKIVALRQELILISDL
jgi:hypothetical protein